MVSEEATSICCWNLLLKSWSRLSWASSETLHNASDATMTR